MLLLKRFSPPAFDVIDTFMDHDADRQKVLFTVTIIPIPFIGLFWDPIKFYFLDGKGRGVYPLNSQIPVCQNLCPQRGGGGTPLLVKSAK